jgi:predicted metal-dependent hydrolase
MVTQIELGNIRVEVVRKDIKNLHLSVYPPAGKVRIAAPDRMGLESIRLFAITRLAWIRRQQKKLRDQNRETAREYLERESHYVWGKRYLLQILEDEALPSVELKHRRLCLCVRKGADAVKRRAVLENWYREVLKAAVEPLLAKWEPRVGVKVNRVYVQHMKTRWGGCNQQRRNIRLNTELAKKPLEYLEYIIVHELAHFREPTHNSRFTTLMDQLIPDWRFFRDELNRLPLRHEAWRG